MGYTKPDASLSELVQEVRSLREPRSVCPSAKTGICINDVLAEVVDKEIYRQDYETITGKLLFTYVPYETVIGGIKEIIRRGYFSNATSAQISLAWMLHKYPNVVPIPGSKNKERIVENLDASKVKLTDEEFHSLEEALDGCRVYGHRGFHR